MSRGAAKMLLMTWGTVGGSLVFSEKRLGIACFFFFFLTSKLLLIFQDPTQVSPVLGSLPDF